MLKAPKKDVLALFSMQLEYCIKFPLDDLRLLKYVWTNLPIDSGLKYLILDFWALDGSYVVPDMTTLTTCYEELPLRSQDFKDVLIRHFILNSLADIGTREELKQAPEELRYDLLRKSFDLARRRKL